MPFDPPLFPTPSRARRSLEAGARWLAEILRRGPEEAHRKALEADLFDLRERLLLTAQSGALSEESADRFRLRLAQAQPVTAEGVALRQTLLHGAGAPIPLPAPILWPAFEHARPVRLLLLEAEQGRELSFNLDSGAALVELMTHCRRQGLLRWPNPEAAGFERQGPQQP